MEITKWNRPTFEVGNIFLLGFIGTSFPFFFFFFSFSSFFGRGCYRITKWKLPTFKVKNMLSDGFIGTSFGGVCHRELHFISYFFSFSLSCGYHQSSKIATFLTSLFHWRCRPTKLPLGAFFKASQAKKQKPPFHI